MKYNKEIVVDINWLKIPKEDNFNINIEYNLRNSGYDPYYKENYPIKFILNRIVGLISLPILFIHELSHFIIGFILGNKMDLFSINFTLKDNGGISSAISYYNLYNVSLFKVILISLSPLFYIIPIFILSFYNIIFLYILLYILFTFKYSFPSGGDIKHIKYYKVFKYNESNNLLENKIATRFFNIHCNINKIYYKYDKLKESKKILGFGYFIKREYIFKFPTNNKFNPDVYLITGKSFYLFKIPIFNKIIEKKLIKSFK